MQAWPETRDTLLARLRDPADMQAWSEFMRLYEPVIKGFVTGRGLQAADAQDICQHVLWAVARAAEEGMVVTRVEARMEAIRARAMVAIQVERPGQRHEGRREAMASTVARMEATAQRAEAVLMVVLMMILKKQSNLVLKVVTSKQ